MKLYNVCELQKLLCVFFVRQPGTDALVCARVNRIVSVDHYFMKGYDTPTKFTVSTDAYTFKCIFESLKTQQTFTQSEYIISLDNLGSSWIAVSISSIDSKNIIEF